MIAIIGQFSHSGLAVPPSKLRGLAVGGQRRTRYSQEDSGRRLLVEVPVIRHILLAVDGSFVADRAADFAASLALRYRARITVLHAFTPIAERAGAPGQGQTPGWTRETAQASVAGTALHLSAMGIAEVATEVVEGPAPNVILGIAETLKPDLIVVGARGLGTWQGQTLGSVSMAVAQRAECPVLVVK